MQKKGNGSRPVGRPPLGRESLTARVFARVTPAEAQQFKALGGSEWLRAMIKKEWGK